MTTKTEMWTDFDETKFIGMKEGQYKLHTQDTEDGGIDVVAYGIRKGDEVTAALRITPEEMGVLDIRTMLKCMKGLIGEVSGAYEEIDRIIAERKANGKQ